MASVGFNPAVNSAATHSAQFSKRLSGAQQQLSSGQRTVNPATDPASSAVGATLKSDVLVFQQLIRNTNNALSVLNYAQQALGNTADLLTQMKGMAAQSFDPTLAGQRENMQKAFTALSNQISNIGNNTEYLNTKLLDGTFSGNFQIGLSTENIMGFALDVNIGNLTSIGSDISTEEGATAAYEAIDDDLYTLSGLVATIAANQTQLQAVVDQLGSQLAAETQAMDTTVGADVNETINNTTTFATQVKIAHAMLQSALQQIKDLGDLVQQASR